MIDDERALPTFDARSRAVWRRWLERHHASKTNVWLVFYKPQAGIISISYEDAVEEALCFGWVDSLIRRVDDERYARKFTPRKADSRWSTSNRRRYESLKARRLLAPPGLDRAPTPRSGDAPRPVSTPRYIADALKANARAWKTFGQLPPSYRRQYVAWIDSAKRDDTRAKRIREAVRLLSAGRKLGLK